MRDQDRLIGSPAKTPSSHSALNRLVRLLWGIVWLVLFRPSPKICWGWRRCLLRLFGAKIGRGCRVLPGVRVWLPSRLEMGDFACLGDGVDCYCVAEIRLAEYATVSQRAFLCTASHSISDPMMPLITAPIEIGKYAWVCAEAFVGPGANMGEGAVLGARGVLSKPLAPWMVAVGNPAKVIKKRVLIEFNTPAVRPPGER